MVATLILLHWPIQGSGGPVVPPPIESQKAHSSTGDKVAEIVGPVIGGIVLISLILALFVWLVIRRRKSRNDVPEMAMVQLRRVDSVSLDKERDWRINSKELEIGDMIGAGTFGRLCCHHRLWHFQKEILEPSSKPGLKSQTNLEPELSFIRWRGAECVVKKLNEISKESEKSILVEAGHMRYQLVGWYLDLSSTCSSMRPHPNLCRYSSHVCRDLSSFTRFFGVCVEEGQPVCLVTGAFLFFDLHWCPNRTCQRRIFGESVQKGGHNCFDGSFYDYRCCLWNESSSSTEYHSLRPVS